MTFDNILDFEFCEQKAINLYHVDNWRSSTHLYRVRYWKKKNFFNGKPTICMSSRHRTLFWRFLWTARPSYCDFYAQPHVDRWAKNDVLERQTTSALHSVWFYKKQ